MIKKTASVVALLIVFSVAAFCQELTNPREIIQKSKTRMLSLNSYRYDIVSEGWDFDLAKTAEATKNLTGEAGGSSLTKKFTKDVDEVDSKPKIMKYETEFRFMKPYMLWMKIVNSDYVPGVLQGAVMRYKYTKKNKKKFHIKTRFLLGLWRGIDTESGSFLYTTWHIQHMRLETLAMDVEPVLEGIEKVDGRDAYKIGFTLEEGKKLTSHKAEIDLKKWNIPAELYFKYIDEIDEFVEDEHWEKIYFYFDVETLDMVCEEKFQPGGEKYSHKEWRNIEVNKLKRKDVK